MKRSSQVALLLMGTVAVGGGAYALMPSENCQPGVVQPDGQLSQVSQNCNRGSGGSSGGRSGGYGYSSGSSSNSSSSSSQRQFFASDGRTNLGSSSSGSDHGSSSVARGGFGSFASHFSGGD